MDVYIVVLRVVHIVGGAFWFGAAVSFAFFIEPTASELGPTGGPFMAHLAQKKKLPIVIAITSVIAIVAGVLLYWRASAGLNTEWITSGPGLGFTTGAGAAIASWLVGFLVLRPGIDKLAAAAAAGSHAEVAQIQRTLRRGGSFNVAFLFVAVAAMASARYW